MAVITAGHLDARNCGAVVQFLDSEGYAVVTTLDGVAKKGDMVYLYTPMQDEPYEVEATRSLDLYLASDAKYGAHSMKILEDIADAVDELKAMAEATRKRAVQVVTAPMPTPADIAHWATPSGEVVPMEVPC